MTSLSLALNNALTSLNVNQRNLSILSHNLSNANTEGYSRQITNQGAIYLDGIGSGVKISSITRKVDIYLQRSVREKSADVGQTETINDYLERAQILMGQPGLQNSIDSRVEGFFNSLQRLAESPELPSIRANSVSNGVTLAREISSLALGLNELRYQADHDIASGVNDANNVLSRLHTLNIAIARAFALGNTTVGLEDERDLELKKLSGYMDVQTYYKENGEVGIYTSNGVPLLEENQYRLYYTPSNSVDVFNLNGTLNALKVIRLDDAGNYTDTSYDLATAGTSSRVTTVLTAGKFKGLLDLRDGLFPDITNQLDNLASVVRDEVNRVHNQGSGYPGANSLTGTRAINATEQYEWSGSVRIAVLDQSGNPVPSGYDDEPNGLRPLTLDLSQLNSGQGNGKPTMQTIINEINAHFGTPQGKASVGLLNDIRLISNNDTLPGPLQQFNFDFELDNLTGTRGEFWVTGVTVLDDTAANITSVTSTIPQVPLDAAATYQTSFASNTVTIGLTPPHTLQNGDRVYLTPPAGAVDGIPAPELGGFFTVSNVTIDSFDIVTNTGALVGGTFAGAPGATAYPRYDTAEAGEISRTNDAGTFTADLVGNPFSDYYDISVQVGSLDDNGAVVTSTITYRVANNLTNLRNDHYSAQSVTGAGTLVPANTNLTSLRAILVDDNGNELSQTNGQYVDDPGFLKLVTGLSTYYVSIDELDSRQLGLPNDSPPVAGTNRGFSHYFELNNFFTSNASSATGDTIAGSAVNMAVESRITANPNLITTGTLTRSNQPADPTALPNWTYSRFSGDNDAIQALARLGISNLSFAAAGSLSFVSGTPGTYAGQILGLAASVASTADSRLKDNQILLEGFEARSDAISGVNLDEELANTIIYQNSYAASARIVTVVNAMFDELVNMI